MDLLPGSYTASVVGFSGALASGGLGGNNSTGQGVTGVFYSMSGTSSSITFTLE